MLELERDQVFRMNDFHDLTKDQLRERTMEKVRFFVQPFGLSLMVFYHHFYRDVINP
jgi:hypothetical protein